MNPKAENAVKKAYICIEAITSTSKIQQTSERRKYMLGVFNTLWCVGLITVDEYSALNAEMQKELPYE